MLTLLKRFSWFEWFAILGVIALGLAAIHLMNKYDRLVGMVAVTEQREQQAQVDLKEEQRSAAITDEVVFDYALERELKITQDQRARDQDTAEYFTTRDALKQEEVSNVSVIPDPPSLGTPTTSEAPKALRRVDTVPNPAALAVLATGMLNSYCSAYADASTCPP